MSALAQILHGQGHPVRGSEQVHSKTVTLLEKHGIRVFLGHRAQNVQGADCVVRSSAIPPDNEEMLEAQKKGIPIVHRAALLARLAVKFQTVAVAGMHGKTTTTNMIYHAFRASGMDPTLISGGIDMGVGSNAHLGRDPVLVLEADESDGSLVFFHPHSAVLTNMEEEHMGFYSNLQQIRDVFRAFASHVRYPGCVAYNADDENLVSLAGETAVPFVSFGIHHDATISARNVNEQREGVGFDVFERGSMLGTITLRVGGMHNVANALAAITIARHRDIGFETIRQGLEDFKGTMRRMELKAQVHGVKVFDDYAHHPTEVRASLEALSHQKEGKLVVVFQPHRYSRVSHLGEDFARSFACADEVVLVPIFSAGESNPGGVSSEDLAHRVKWLGHPMVRTCESLREVAAQLTSRLQAGDVVVGMGAGDIEQFAPMMKDSLLNAAKEVSPC